VGTDPHDTAFREVQRLQQKAGESLAALTVNQIQKALSVQLHRALEDHDYETAIEECRKGLSILEKLLEQYASRKGK